jgi:hypothetical protein
MKQTNINAELMLPLSLVLHRESEAAAGSGDDHRFIAIHIRAPLSSR